MSNGVLLEQFGRQGAQISDAVRIHWQIENAQHWLLGVVFRENDSRLREGLAAENLALVRWLVLNLLSPEATHKGSKRGSGIGGGLTAT